MLQMLLCVQNCVSIIPYVHIIIYPFTTHEYVYVIRKQYLAIIYVAKDKYIMHAFWNNRNLELKVHDIILYKVGNLLIDVGHYRL